MLTHFNRKLCHAPTQSPHYHPLARQNGEHIYIIHFTYGNDFDVEGKFTPGKVGAWHFDKRDYVG